jgi:hypothetical protein
MPAIKRLKFSSCLLTVLFLLWPAQAHAYIGGPPATLGMMCSWSTHAIQVRVEKIDRDKKIIVWRRLQDYKGKWPGGELIQQSFPNLQPGDRDTILHWAEVGKVTVMFALESYKWSHTYIDNCWFAANTGDWQAWNVNHVEPGVLHTYCGRAEKLQNSVTAILAGKEVIIPVIADGKDNPPNVKVQRLRASMKLTDFNPKRDFVGWGGEDFEPLLGMSAFSRFTTIPRLGPDTRGISIVDFDGDGKLDVCLFGANRFALLQNSGDSLSESLIPGITAGCQAALWADYNSDGKPDLLVITSAGPKLYTNLGNGNFRDDSVLLPKEPCYDLTTAAWIDYDGTGRPSILLGNGYHGLRLYRNGGAVQSQQPPKPGSNWIFDDVSDKVGLGAKGLGSAVKGDSLVVADVNGDGRPDILYGAGNGLLLLNTPDGFIEAKDSGIRYQPGNTGPVFGDFDNSGALSLFVPQVDAPCRLFKNDGKGRFSDVTAKSGDLSKPIGIATSAAWGDFFGQGRLDLVVGCLKGPNRLFRNNGDGTFTDATEEVGLHKHVYNTQSVAFVDLNHDGMPDLIFNNEGQDSIVLLGDNSRSRKRTPLAVYLAGTGGVVGSRLTVVGTGDKLVAMRELGASDGRGGQPSTQAYFTLEPGNYRLEIRYSSGQTRSHEITIADKPQWITDTGK